MRQTIKKSYQNLAQKVKNNLQSAYSANYIPYGVDPYDVFPRYLIALSKSSSTLRAGIEKNTQFIVGNGFARDEVGEISVNRNGLTLSELFQNLAAQISTFNSFAFHVNYDNNLQVAELNTVQFENLRLGQPDKNGDINYIVDVNYADPYVLDQQLDTYNETYPIFNPDKKALSNQIKSIGNGGFNDNLLKFNGQIFYDKTESPGAFWYADPSYVAVLEDAEAEALLKISRKTDVKEGFKATTIISVFGASATSPAEREKIAEEYSQFLDPDGSRVLVRHVLNPEQADKIDAIETMRDFTKTYLPAEESLRKNIQAAFGYPDILYGFAQAGKLGTKSEFKDAVAFGNHIASSHKKRIIFAIKKALRFHSNPSFRALDLSTKPFAIFYE